MYLINENKQCYVELHNKNGEYSISDWRDISNGFVSPVTVLGLTGESLFKWLYEHKYRHMTQEERAFYELAK